MKERPILFNTEMVKAVLDDRKTQTRRLMKPQPECRENKNLSGHFGTFFHGWNLDHPKVPALILKHCPYGQIGDRLWVRETFKGYGRRELPPKFFYRASDPDVWPHIKWTPSIHMPREVSRINLEITDIRVERVQDITEEDAKAEGMTSDDDPYWIPSYSDPDSGGYPSYKNSFNFIWDEIYKNWGVNPWVWVVEFKPC